MKNIRTYINHIREQKESSFPSWLLKNPEAWAVFYLENLRAEGLVGVYSSEEEASMAYDAALDELYAGEIEMSLNQWFDERKEEDFSGYESMEDYAKDHPDTYKEWWAQQRSDISDAMAHDVEFAMVQFGELPELIEESHVDYEPLLRLIEENPDMIHDPSVEKHLARRVKTKRLFGI
jgi:hypothetical protein